MQLRNHLVLILFILQAMSGNAQKKLQPIKRMKIGEEYPNLPLGQLINYTGKNTTIADFRGKPLILDFWATWCAPCVESFSKIDSFQKEFKNKLVILPITSQSNNTAYSLLKNLNQIKGIRMIESVVDDTSHIKASGHRVVPHLIWIDAQGIVRAITSHHELNRENIESFISGELLPVPLKNDYTFKAKLDKPLLNTDYYHPGNLTLYHSIITKFRQDMPGGSFSGGNRITCPNHTLSGLYALAFGEFSLEFLNPNRRIIQGATSLEDSFFLGVINTDTRKKWKQVRHLYLYTYELLVDSSFSRKQKFSIMQKDLNNYFNTKGINGKLEKHKQKVLALVRTNTADLISTKGGKAKDSYTPYSIQIVNHSIFRFVSKFQAYFYKLGSLPIIDQTNYKGNIDITINCDLTDIEAVNREISRYNLKFEPQEHDIDMLVIEMNKPQQQFNSIK